MTLTPALVYEHPRPIYNATMILISEAAEFLNSDKKMLAQFLRENPKAFLKEFATIKVASHRRAGHTTAMMQIAANQLKHPDSHLCLVFPTLVMQKRVTKELKERTNGMDRCTAITIHAIDRKTRGMAPFDLVLLDCSSLMSATAIDKMYDALVLMLAIDRAPLIVFFE